MLGFARRGGLGTGDGPREQTAGDGAAQTRGVVVTAGIVLVVAAIVASTLAIVWPHRHQVASFVRPNRTNLASSLDGLARVTTVLAAEKASLETFLAEAPEAAANTNLAYDSLSRSLLARINLQQTQNLSMWACSLVYSLGVPPKQCEPLLRPLNFLGQTLGQVAHSNTSWLTTLTTRINVKQPPPDAYGPGG